MSHSPVRLRLLWFAACVRMWPKSAFLGVGRPEPDAGSDTSDAGCQRQTVGHGLCERACGRAVWLRFRSAVTKRFKICTPPPGRYLTGPAPAANASAHPAATSYRCIPTTRLQPALRRPNLSL
jgi:hypothetical protein